MNLNPRLLETKSLQLTGYSPQDIAFIFEHYSKDEIKRILGHRSEEEYRIESSKNNNGYASYNRSFILFLLTDKATNKIIGRCGIHNWNQEHNRAEIGYVILEEDFKRKGLMSEAVTEIIDYGFAKLNLYRLEALVGINNLASIKIIENHNFTKEGVLRQYFRIGDGFEDAFLYSLLRKEFFEIA